MTEKECKKGLLLRTAMLSLALLAVTSAFIAGWLPVRLLGPTLIAAIAPFALIYWRFIRRFSVERRAELQALLGPGLDEATRKRYRSSIRTLRITAAAFAAILIYASFATAGEPLLSRLAGAAFNILIIFSCLATARRLQQKLRESQAATDHLS